MKVSTECKAVDSRGRLFFIAVLALFTAGMAHSMRAGVASDIQQSYLVSLNPLQATAMTGEILGAAFLGFAFSLFMISPLLDVIGMRLVLVIAAICIAAGDGIVLLCDQLAPGMQIYWLLWAGMLVMGIGWGCVEATINPLITALYPGDKTGRMNMLHAWWPGGLIAGGLLSVLLAGLDVNWKIQLALVFVPCICLLFLLGRVSFPMTERAAAGISWGGMMTEMFRSPGIFVWIFIIFLAAGSELAPGQFVDLVLTNTVGMRGILLLVYVSGLMFVMRHFAGAIAHRIPPVTMMTGCSILTALGLYGLSLASSPVTAIAAATLWGGGVCFLWPTIMATVADRYPRGGSFFIGLIATTGALSSTVILPYLGRIYDRSLQDYLAARNLPEGAADANEAAVEAASSAFQANAVLPVILFVLFVFILYRDRQFRRRQSGNRQPLAPGR